MSHIYSLHKQDCSWRHSAALPHVATLLRWWSFTCARSRGCQKVAGHRLQPSEELICSTAARSSTMMSSATPVWPSKVTGRLPGVGVARPRCPEVILRCTATMVWRTLLQRPFWDTGARPGNPAHEQKRHRNPCTHTTLAYSRTATRPPLSRMHTRTVCYKDKGSKAGSTRAQCATPPQTRIPPPHGRTAAGRDHQQPLLRITTLPPPARPAVWGSAAVFLTVPPGRAAEECAVTPAMSRREPNSSHDLACICLTLDPASPICAWTRPAQRVHGTVCAYAKALNSNPC